MCNNLTNIQTLNASPFSTNDLRFWVISIKSYERHVLGVECSYFNLCFSGMNMWIQNILSNNLLVLRCDSVSFTLGCSKFDGKFESIQNLLKNNIKKDITINKKIYI